MQACSGEDRACSELRLVYMDPSFLEPSSTSPIGTPDSVQDYINNFFGW